MRHVVLLTLLLASALVGLRPARGQDAPAPVPLDPETLAAQTAELRTRQQRFTSRAVSYLWEQRLDPETGNIGKVQVRYLQALSYLALVAEGAERDPRLAARKTALLAGLSAPLSELGQAEEGESKLFVGTSREALEFETHAVVALAYAQLAASPALATAAERQRYWRGTESAIEYLMEFRKRGRDYANSGGWPVNAQQYNRNRPDRRTTAWVLTLLKAHAWNGGKSNATALEEAPNFILAAQRLAPPLTERLKEAAQAHEEWAPRLRRGETPPPELRDLLNEHFEYRRQRDDAGGFGVDTLGITSGGATAIGLYTLGLVQYPEAARHQAAAQALIRLPLNYEAQRFFEAQFFAVRGLRYYSETWRTGDFLAYMNRLLTLLEQHQAADGSLPPGSRGVEELNQMERVYSTAMGVLIVNCNRGLLVGDRLPY